MPMLHWSSSDIVPYSLALLNIDMLSNLESFKEKNLYLYSFVDSFAQFRKRRKECIKPLAILKETSPTHSVHA